jgi:predicted nucleic acid-binding protein
MAWTAVCAGYPKGKRRRARMIVVDTSVVFPLFNEMEGTRAAQKVRDKDAVWALPPLWKDEYANVLVKLSRKLKIDWGVVHQNYQTVLVALRPCEAVVSLEQALRLAFERRLSFYDAQFAWLAQEHNTWLVTEDLELLKRIPDVAVSMEGFLALTSA